MNIAISKTQGHPGRCAVRGKFLISSCIILGIAAIPSLAAEIEVTEKIDLHYALPIRENSEEEDYQKNNDHTLVDEARIRVKWAAVNPEPGVFRWETLDTKINIWTSGGAKKIILKVVPHGQNPASDSEVNKNTPHRGYSAGVSPIRFKAGGVKSGEYVIVPKVWGADNAKFLEIYGSFLRALGEKYNADPRVGGVYIGYGHLGTMNAQPSKDGAEVFLRLGWSLELWKQYVKSVNQIYKTNFQKELFFRMPSKFMEKFKVEEY